MVKIVVDSSCDFSDELKNKVGINIESVPLTLQLDGKEYVDDETLNLADYVEAMGKCKTVPKTAAPSPDSYLRKFYGPESIFVVTISSKLSASYNNALLAKEMYLSEVESKFIHVFDSLGASVYEALIALKIHELAKLNFSDLEIVNHVTEFMKVQKIYFILEKFDNLVKNGRMNPYMAKAASLLSIKPICTGVDGNIELLSKARGFTKAVAKIIDTMIKESDGFENRILAISHVQCIEKALEFKRQVMERLKFKEIIIVEMGGLCSTYADNGGIIISY